MKKAGIITVLILWLGGLGYAHSVISTEVLQKNRVRSGIVLPPFSQLDPRLLNIMTLGHRAVYDDFIHIWFNHYLVDEAHLKKHPEDAIKIGDILLRLKPAIETSYMLTCVVFMNDIDRPEYCEPVIQTGMRIFPNSFMLPMMQGFILYKKLDNPKRAAAYYAMAAQTERAPGHVIRVAEKLLQNEPLTEAEIDRMSFDFGHLIGADALHRILDKQQQRAQP